MTADTPTPTPPERDPHDAAGRADAPDPADAPTAQHDPPRPSDPVPPPADPVPAGLYRSTHDRWLAGVCGGIAERYGIESVIVRLAFLATLLIGGAGVLFYIAAAIVIPNPPAGRDDAIGAPGGAPTSVGGGILRILVTLAVALAVLCGLIVVGAVSFAATVFLGAWPAAVLLVVLAALLAVVARNRRSAATVLVLIVAIAAPAAAAVIADLSVDRSMGNRSERPGLVAEAAEGYRLGLGEMTVDLRELRPRAGSTLDVPVRVDVGRAAIVIPDDRCIAWTIRTTIGAAGDVRVLGGDGHDSWGGHQQQRTFRIDPGGERRPQITVDAHVGVGEIVVGHTLDEINAYGGPGTADRSVIRTDACRGEAGRR